EGRHLLPPPPPFARRHAGADPSSRRRLRRGLADRPRLLDADLAAAPVRLDVPHVVAAVHHPHGHSARGSRRTMTIDSGAGGIPRPRLTPQVVVGLMVITLGVLFTLDNLGILDARDYIVYWPIVLVLIGATKIWQAIRDGHGWFGGLFLFVV